MTQIAIILGSTRPGRRVETVARWVAEAADRHPAIKAGEVSVELVDIADYGLPLLDEPAPAATGYYQNAHTKRWAARIDRFDGYVFVTPEYNSAVPAALKNAIDYLWSEWNHKAAGIVSYGLYGGTRAAEQLRQTMAEIKVADVHAQVAINPFIDFDFTESEAGACAPGERQEALLTTMLDEILEWSRALRVLRDPTASADPRFVPT
ncbi:NADPH-dependent oxidoreductase [Actinobacteria bacterium YIM 96077]|uniref:NADPH-dependent FMN reductase n=1 Tax=Phytoactinopolyspora halophila TaxID=1981511 RepID=A0A329R0H0_9ACTN|nr:NAD(P)H-dependent oxidoreductase [Phytoactinopolyspora halophila]AYY11714.1 NADPH-dependent oxidoreductase [Actinobacteria bacterium YIM 96077]RAW17853.1 NADPH-dependent FMN reductase [Phytoactinopolyspora halophila]